MGRFTRRAKLFILAASAIAGVAIFLVDHFLIARVLPHLYNDLIIMAYMVAIIPPMAADFIDSRWRASVNRRLPSLLREVAMGQLAGKTLPKALEDASKTDRGALSTELRKTLGRIQMGAGFHTSLNELGERIGTKLSRQSMKLIVISDLYGGKTYEVFDRAADYVESMVAYHDERSGRVSPYVATFYVAVAIFVGLTLMVLRWLLPAFLSIGEVSAFLGRPTILGTMRLEDYRDTFLMATVVISSFAGLTAGKISGGSLSAGVKHIGLLVLASYFAYLIFVGT
ncbi:MAG: type II secretion system F family protein [Candidatus Bathyarchaeia archaeon]